jgi:hypothetical protein
VDLFEEDKRLALKPVRAFGDLLMEAFAKGPCTCIRCRENHGSQEGYQYQHTFEIDGVVLNRRFAVSSHSDVRGALSKAWEAYYKIALPEHGPADMGAISVLVQGEASRRLRPMLYAVGVVKDVDDIPHFSAGMF